MQLRERLRKRGHRRAREREVTLDEAGVVRQRGGRQ